jgi:hypothetical protein
MSKKYYPLDDMRGGCLVGLANTIFFLWLLFLVMNTYSYIMEDFFMISLGFLTYKKLILLWIVTIAFILAFDIRLIAHEPITINEDKKQ